MKKSIAIVLFLSLLSTVIYAQELEPLDLARKIFDRKTTIDFKKHSTGEYNGEPSGRGFTYEPMLNFRLLGQDDDMAVVNMTILDSLGVRGGVDTYLFFKKDIIWKMSAFRSLAMVGMLEMMIDEIENLSLEELDAMTEKLGKDQVSDYDSDFMLNNAKLIIDLDDNIIKHFEVHKSSFDSLRNKALVELSTVDTSNIDQTINLIESEKDNYEKLLISNVNFNDYSLSVRCVSFCIGGILDNTVGYLYVEDKADLPKMNPGYLIMLREIGDGWYMYKTT